MGILRTFEKIGDGLLGMFLKLFLILILILVILGFVIGIAVYWKFVVSIMIGALFSPYLYAYIEKNLQLGLPEFFFWNYGDVMEAFFVNEQQIEEVNQENRQKIKAARLELDGMDKKYANLTVAYEDLKAKKNLKEILVGKKSKKYNSSRLRKAVLMNIGDPEWVSEMKDIKTEVNWSKYL